MNYNLSKSLPLFLKDILASFAISRGFILIIAFFSQFAVLKGKWFHAPKNIFDIFYTWDSSWYMSIVQSGYNFIPGKQSSVAFFPLYPILVKFFSFGFLNPFFVGLVISNASLIFASIYFYKLIQIDYPEPQIAKKAIFFLLISPLSFFFSIFYTEGLLLFLTIGAFYYARKKKWFIASLMGFFLALTRSEGILIVIPLAMEYLGIGYQPIKNSFKKIKKDIFYFLFIPAGLMVYMFFLYIKFKDGFVFLKAQSEWGRKFVPIFTTISNVNNFPLFYRLLFLGTVFFALIMILYLIHLKMKLSYISYCLIFLLFYLSTNSLEAIPRHVSILFPIYIGLSVMANKNENLNNLLVLSSVGLLTLFTILFANGYWFT